ncbi:unnamed protein product [Cyprideis torosa]|uniref:Uncharacterized protein n=1 Tax=Cyprideis torosa TaxID=163714 RepID=A0A7R8W9B9_9CRUS|nr:unnamed protein product [Cyprideis torosa]CAG0889613.1 unnamed protein product [Cyprideis torosa]
MAGLRIFLFLSVATTLAYGKEEILSTKEFKRVVYYPETYSHVSIVEEANTTYNCYATGPWYLPDLEEVTISLECEMGCSPVTDVDISSLVLFHSYKRDIGIRLEKDDRYALIKSSQDGDACAIDWNVSVDDDGQGGYLDEFCDTVNSPPSYLPLTSLSDEFQGIDGCGNWTLVIADVLGGDVGEVLEVGITYQTTE